MKTIVYFLLLTLAIPVAVISQAKTTAPKQAEISFTKVEHDFGEITEGTMATTNFEFKNTGKAPLVLSNVTTSTHLKLWLP